MIFKKIESPTFNSCNVTMTSFLVQSKGESATVCFREWINQPTDLQSIGSKKTYGGELLIKTSFGNFCNTWDSCLIPFKRFLAEVNFESFMSSTGFEASIFSYEKSLKCVLQHLNSREMFGAIDSVQADTIRGCLKSKRSRMQLGPAEFVNVLYDISGQYSFANCFLANPNEFVCKHPNPLAVGFWDKLWPDILKIVN